MIISNQAPQDHMLLQLNNNPFRGEKMRAVIASHPQQVTSGGTAYEYPPNSQSESIGRRSLQLSHSQSQQSLVKTTK